MAEERIEITIDENGKITASTEGIKGETCIDELSEILEGLADISSLKKTDEYFQNAKVTSKNTIKIKKS